MSTESEQTETELVTAPDGKAYRVYKEYTPLPPLPITAAEEKMLDRAIASMVARFHQDGVKVEHPRFVCQEKEACAAIDKIVADEMWNLRKIVPNESAEKLLQRLGKVSPETDEDALAVGVLFIRFMDTMEAMVSYKRRFRGKDREHCKYTKEVALGILRQRGLVRQ